jgi:hypothetical protein
MEASDALTRFGVWGSMMAGSRALLPFLLAMGCVQVVPSAHAADGITVTVIRCNCNRADNPNHSINAVFDYLGNHNARDSRIIVAGDDGSTATWGIDHYNVPNEMISGTPPTGSGGGGCRPDEWGCNPSTQ